MTAESYMNANGAGQNHYGFPSSSQPLSPMSQPDYADSSNGVQKFLPGVDRVNGQPDGQTCSAIFMRKLPRNTTPESLRSMLLFTKDFIRADFTHPEDSGYVSAIARFRSSHAAQEARDMLDGKPNTAGETNMIVEVLHLSPGETFSLRRNTLDNPLGLNATNSGAPTGSSGGPNGRQSSRYNGTFQTLDRISPSGGTAAYANGGAPSSSELPTPDTASSFQNLFSPQSPIGHPLERQRISGKSVIGEDAVDDETGKLLNDPVAYAKNDLAGMAGLSRRATNPQMSNARFTGLSLGGNGMASPSMQPFASPRSTGPLQSPTSAMSPTGMANLGPNATYQLAGQHYQRHNYPPVNPSDQNPPCNTLYVGNLPADTSEDELKAIFSKQRGYKRLCFRTKTNGPMCFVEFEDVSFATKALSELYGQLLHNSVKGGIRLSFSKNPLGVRTGQPGGIGPPTPLSPQGPMPHMNGLGPLQPFSTASGPPPGLAAPPGLGASNEAMAASMNGLSSPSAMNMFHNPFNGPMSPISGMGMSGIKSQSMAAVTRPGGLWNGHGGTYSDHMVGR